MGIAIESDKEKYIHEFTSNFHFTGPNDINNKPWNVRTKINANEKKGKFYWFDPRCRQINRKYKIQNNLIETIP